MKVAPVFFTGSDRDVAKFTRKCIRRQQKEQLREELKTERISLWKLERNLEQAKKELKNTQESIVRKNRKN